VQAVQEEMIFAVNVMRQRAEVGGVTSATERETLSLMFKIHSSHPNIFLWQQPFPQSPSAFITIIRSCSDVSYKSIFREPFTPPRGTIRMKLYEKRFDYSTA
jgi:hypothetical protein